MNSLNKTLVAVLALGLTLSGVAQAATSPTAAQAQDPSTSKRQAAPVVVGADTAASASTGGVTAATVVGVSIVVGAVALIAVGASRDGHHAGTTGTH